MGFISRSCLTDRACEVLKIEDILWFIISEDKYSKIFFEYLPPMRLVLFSYMDTIGTPRVISATRIPFVGEKASSSG